MTFQAQLPRLKCKDESTINTPSNTLTNEDLAVTMGKLSLH